MHRIIRQLTTAILLLLPLTAAAVTFDDPGRSLTVEENKIGSVYRGCIGFHCLEEAPYTAWSMTVAASCADGDGPSVPGSLPGGEGEVCLSLGTNAREGALVLVRSASGAAEVCPVATDRGLRAEGDCVSAAEERVVASSADRLDDGFVKFFVRGEEADLLTFVTVIAY